jgi:hypothetical protein
MKVFAVSLALLGCVEVQQPQVMPPTDDARPTPIGAVDAQWADPTADARPPVRLGDGAVSDASVPDARPPADAAPALDGSVDQRCGLACGHVSGCVDEFCETASLDYEGCRESCAANPAGFDPDRVASQTCQEVQATLCASGLPDGCGCGPEFESNIGEACDSDDDCRANGLPPNCITQWPGGYCVGANCGGSGGCPAGTLCIQFNGDGNTMCVRTCEAVEDCRPEYECVAAGQDVRLCIAPGATSP